MTKEQKIEAYTMLLDGKTLQEVADRFGVSKQRMSQIFPHLRNIRKESAANSCIYPNIAAWMRSNNVGYTDIARRVHTSAHNVRNFLCCGMNGRKFLIDGILEATGPTYEEAFRKDG